MLSAHPGLRPRDPRLGARGETGRPEEPGAAVPHSHRRPDAAVAARGLDASSPGRPQAYAAVTVKPSSPARLLKVGAVVLISGAVLLLLGAIGAFYFWKGSDNHVSPEAHGVAGAPGSLACPLLGGPSGSCALGGLPGTSSLLPPNSRTWLPTDGQLRRKASLGFKSGVAGGCSGGFQGSPSPGRRIAAWRLH